MTKNAAVYPSDCGDEYPLSVWHAAFLQRRKAEANRACLIKILALLKKDRKRKDEHSGRKTSGSIVFGSWQLLSSCARDIVDYSNTFFPVALFCACIWKGACIWIGKGCVYSSEDLDSRCLAVLSMTCWWRYISCGKTADDHVSRTDLAKEALTVWSA